MGKIYVVGLGPGAVKDLTLEAVERINSGDKNFLRTKYHPTLEYLKEKNIPYESFDYVYDEAESFEDVYTKIVDNLALEAKKEGTINYLVPGNPLVAENTVKLLLDKGLDIEIISGLSFIEPILELVERDPIDGLQIVDGLVFDMVDININLDTIITQVHDRFILSDIKLVLASVYGDEFMVYYIQNAGIKGQETLEFVPVYQLDRLEEPNLLTSIYLPRIEENNEKVFDFRDLLDIMTMLRSEDGCMWDREQTHKSMRSSMIEEAYEVVDAINSGEIDSIIEELGDVLLQVIFHSQIGEEEGTFNIYDVTSTLGEKLIYRHPHVFSKKQVENSSDIVYNWNILKQKKRNLETYSQVLKDIKGLPSLLTSYKVQKQAARVGFDWNDITGPIGKIKEELEEVVEAIEKYQNPDKIEEEIGDLLFSVVNLSRFVEVNPEIALKLTIDKFIERFTYIEEKSRELGKSLEDMTLEEMDRFWVEAKARKSE